MWLKQSTVQVINFGPVLDSGDGKTLEVAAGIITSIDHATTGIMLSKNGGTFAVREQGVNFVASTYDAHGCFKVSLSAIDTGTLGRLRVIHTEPATYLAVWQDFMVIPAQVWDSFFGADKLDVAVVEQANIDFGALQLASLNAATPASVQNIPATGSGFTALGDARIANLDAKVSDVKTKTDNLPSDPADESLVIAATDAIMSRLGIPAGASLAADLLAIDNFVDELESRLSALRAGYLDNLSAGAVALEATLTAIKGTGWTTETLKAIKAAVDAASYTTILQGLAVTMSADLLTVNIDGVATSITLKQGEAKTLLITVLDADGVAVDLSAATLTLGFKAAKADVAYVIEKDDADFDKTLAASGIVSVDFTETDTDQDVATYIGELKASWTGGAVINKSADIKLKIKEAVIPPA